MPVIYEWDVETVVNGDTLDHEDGEVLDHHHCETYLEACVEAATQPEQGCRHAIVLVRDDDEGRAWAYVEAGALPEYFTDADGREAHRVPKRFVRLLNKGAA